MSCGEKANDKQLNTGVPESKDTTRSVEVDSVGNIMNITHFLWSNSGIMNEGLGFMYNNGMMVFDPQPGQIGSLVPVKARFTAKCPTIIWNQFAATWAPITSGGTTVIVGIPQAI